jgi:hypothetical protein
MQRPNFYLLVRFKLPGWSRALPLPLPLFVVDHIVEFISALLSLGGGSLARHGGKYGVAAAKFSQAMYGTWWGVRHSGSYTLLELDTDDFKLSVKVI